MTDSDDYAARTAAHQSPTRESAAHRYLRWDRRCAARRRGRRAVGGLSDLNPEQNRASGCRSYSSLQRGAVRFCAGTTTEKPLTVASFRHSSNELNGCDLVWRNTTPPAMRCQYQPSASCVKCQPFIWQTARLGSRGCDRSRPTYRGPRVLPPHWQARGAAARHCCS